MAKRLFKTVDEVREKREELDSQYEGDLPQYIVDVLDENERKLLKAEFFAQRRQYKYNTPLEERLAYKENEEREFWEQNETQIVKRPRAVPNEHKFTFKEPDRGPIDNERELTPEEISIPL